VLNRAVARLGFKLRICPTVRVACFIVWGFATNVCAAENKTFIWHFDEGSGDIAREATGSGNDGRFNDPGIQWTEGKVKNGLAFSGSDAHPQWIHVPHSPDMDIQKAITMEAWVLRLDTTSQVVVCLYGLEPTGYQCSNSRVKLNQWTHIAVTYDGAEIKFYINGEQDENVIRASGKIKSTTNPIHFGGDPSG
jgi:hypothetical protein